MQDWTTRVLIGVGGLIVIEFLLQLIFDGVESVLLVVLLVIAGAIYAARAGGLSSLFGRGEETPQDTIPNVDDQDMTEFDE